MKGTRTFAFAILPLASLALAIPSAALEPPPQATVSARKDSVEISLRLYKKQIRAKKSLWYQLELKNVGKEPLLVTDKIFRDPWAMHQNCRSQRGVYLEVEPVSFRSGVKPQPDPKRPYHLDLLRGFGGEGRVRYDYLEKGVGPEEGKRVNQVLRELDEKRAKKEISDIEWAQRKTKFQGDWHEDQSRAEDLAKEFYLAPGASTTTFAWSYRCQDSFLCSPEQTKNPGKSARIYRLEWDVQDRPIGDYTQLWSYYLFEPGTYKVRAVYPHGLEEERRRSRLQDGGWIKSWEVDVKTPYIEFDVLP